MKKQMINKGVQFTKQYKRAWKLIFTLCLPVVLFIQICQLLGEFGSWSADKMIKFFTWATWHICYAFGVEGFFYKDISEEDDEK